MDPDASPKVKELRSKLANEAVDLNQLESEVYDHLFSFFRRYYSEGDFLAKRVYKQGVYAIPYEGEEVTLHWANKDQYYIKTSEYLRDYAFRLQTANEQKPMRVHFRLVDAAEGEHGNVKEAVGKERRFKLAAEKFAAVENGELVIRFTYQSEVAKQKELNAAAEATILEFHDATLAEWLPLLAAKHQRADGSLADTSRLRVHLDRYSARNTFDYFIHKDLGGFLRRELDFYIKNEVMQLDDIESDTVPRVEQYLSKLKVLRRIAGKIIDFLAQLEEFQKKLWLKKKFVTETSYCIRLGVIPEEFYPEIAANEAQREEWVNLCGIDLIIGDDRNLLEPARESYSAPLSVEFLKQNSALMLDTRNFSENLKEAFLSALNEQNLYVDGMLVHGNNVQALSLIENCYKGKLSTVFADPPYNTGSDEFSYRDSYQHSSWLSMMEHVLNACWSLLSSKGTAWITLDDNESERLWLAANNWFGSESSFPRIAWQHSIQGKGYEGSVSVHHNSLLCFARSKEARVGLLQREDHHNRAYGNPDHDPKGDWRTGDVRNSLFRPNLRYKIPTPSGGFIDPPDNGWRWKWETMQQKIASGEVFFSEDESRITRKIYLVDQEGRVPESIWFGEEAGTTRSANSELKALFETVPFGTPKPTELINRICALSCVEIILDPFAGSGTTGHSVINLNRIDGGKRKFILAEQADYFDTVMLPRLKKVSFAPEWKDGKPKRLATAEETDRSPRIIKVLRLESYEDTLNNLDTNRSTQQQTLLDAPAAQGADNLKEQYLLRYLLDVETRGSQSLLNVQAFSDPTAYTLKVKRPGSDESREVNVDLIETFNWLLGLSVQHLAAPQIFTAGFVRDGEGRLQLDGRLKQDAAGPWWFRTVTGTTPDGRKALVVWRKLTGTAEQDNLVLDEWFRKHAYSTRDADFDLIYVNGGNNLPNVRLNDERWKVRLIEEDFHRLMFDTEGL